jgi:hypothetical protein
MMGQRNDPAGFSPEFEVIMTLGTSSTVQRLERLEQLERAFYGDWVDT